MGSKKKVKSGNIGIIYIAGIVVGFSLGIAWAEKQASDKAAVAAKDNRLNARFTAIEQMLWPILQEREQAKQPSEEKGAASGNH